jgi:uncharacterized membrane protein YdjX (TVP38/TMEM64 family)
MSDNALETGKPARPAPGWAPIRKHALTLAVVIAGLAVFASSDVLHQLFLRIVGAGEDVIIAHPFWGLSLFVLFSALSAMLAFFSTAVITPVAVQTWGEPISIGLLWIGWMLGGMSAYWLGRTLGRPVARALTSTDALDRFENRISTHAPFGLVLLFQLAMPSEVPGYVLGLARYRFVKYVLVLSLVELPFAIGTVYLGASFLERRTALLLSIGAAGIAFTTWALYALQKRMSD